MDIEGLDTATKAHEIYPMVEFIHDLLVSKKYSEVDDILESTPLDKLSLTSMSTLVRTTYSMKRYLTKWEFARDRIAEEMGADSEKYLRGLFDPRTPDCASIHKIIGLEAP